MNKTTKHPSLTPSEWVEIHRLLNTYETLDITQQKDFLARLQQSNTNLYHGVQFFLSNSIDTFYEQLSEWTGEINQTISTPEVIGSYNVLKSIGYGGSSTVYLAERQDPYAQKVAIKVFHHTIQNAWTQQRFELEWKILARLTHPNIVHFIDGGLLEGSIPYLVMEYVEGSNIYDYATQNKTTLRERLLLFLEVCDTIHFAHQHSVIHRDIKPANILVTNERYIKLLDFGIAKLIAFDDESIAHSLHRVFTPGYVSPEQIKGEIISTQTDVYLLGVVLYKLLTQQLPLSSTHKSLYDYENDVLSIEPQPPSLVCQEAFFHEIKGDLDAIIIKALAKKQVHRYETVKDFADDIRRFINQQPVHAHLLTWSYRAKKFFLRNKFPVAISGLIFAFLVIWFFSTQLQFRKTQLAQLQTEILALYLEDLIQEYDANEPNSLLPDSTSLALFVERSIEKATTNLSNEPELQGKVYNMLSRMLISRNASGTAKDLATKAYNLSSKALGENHLQTLISKSIIANALENMNEDSLARSLYTEILQKYKTQNLVTTKSYGELLNRYGMFLIKHEQFNEAIESLQASYEVLNRIPLVDEEDIIEPLGNLGVAYHHKNDFTKAESLMKEVITRGEQCLPLNHPSLISGYANLGQLLADQQKTEEAYSYLERALNAHIDRYGYQNTRTVLLLNTIAFNLAVKARKDNDYKKVIDFLQQSLNVAKQLEDKTLVGLTARNLALMLRDAGQFSEAMSLALVATQVYSEALGESHPTTVRSLSTYAYTLYLNKHYREAIQAYKKILQYLPEKEETLIERVQAYNYILSSLLAVNNLTIAKPYFQKLNEQLPDLPKDHWIRGIALSTKGQYFMQTHQRETGIRFLQEGYDLLNETSSQGNLRLQEAKTRLEVAR